MASLRVTLRNFSLLNPHLFAFSILSEAPRTTLSFSQSLLSRRYFVDSRGRNQMKLVIITAVQDYEMVPNQTMLLLHQMMFVIAIWVLRSKIASTTINSTARLSTAMAHANGWL